MKYKVIQVPVDEDLLKELDRTSKQRRQSRAALIREACAQYITRLEEAEADRRYIQAYTDMPETDEEHAWAELGLKMLAETTTDDDWSEWDADVNEAW